MVAVVSGTKGVLPVPLQEPSEIQARQGAGDRQQDARQNQRRHDAANHAFQPLGEGGAPLRRHPVQELSRGGEFGPRPEAELRQRLDQGFALPRDKDSREARGQEYGKRK
jgi:hypothetical protein